MVELRELHSPPEKFAAPNMSRITVTGTLERDKRASKKERPGEPGL
jgi:hypothetical protein